MNKKSSFFLGPRGKKAPVLEFMRNNTQKRPKYQHLDILVSREFKT